jgi:hypothetical protein
MARYHCAGVALDFKMQISVKALIGKTITLVVES